MPSKTTKNEDIIVFINPQTNKLGILQPETENVEEIKDALFGKVCFIHIRGSDLELDAMGVKYFSTAKAPVDTTKNSDNIES